MKHFSKLNAPRYNKTVTLLYVNTQYKNYAKTYGAEKGQNGTRKADAHTYQGAGHMDTQPEKRGCGIPLNS